MGEEGELKHTELVDFEGNELFEEAFMLTPEEVDELKAARALAEALELYKPNTNCKATKPI